MAQCVIEARELSKRYRIHHGRARQDGLRHVMTSWLTRPFVRGGATEDLWAIRDISFDVQAGEVLGVIGRNGSGKTTLLKVLSRITPPTSGQAKLTGRVGSLLEVGTGFHPDLTGRENIYLNGSILGMRKREIIARFDEIVAFSEIERFLDTPVKRYSSGMYVRLAFAIAAHLQPEILLIDEVLAVGDVAFQKKCLGKMRDVARGGRTVLFVSHNMAAVRSLCDRAMVLQAGQASHYDDVEQGVRAYLAAAAPHAGQVWLAEQTADPPDTDVIRPVRLALMDAAGHVADPIVRRDERVSVELDFELKRACDDLTIGVAVYDTAGTYLFHSYQTDGPEGGWPRLAVGMNRLVAELPVALLNEGDYRVVVQAAIHKNRWLLRAEDTEAAVAITVAGGSDDSPLWEPARRGPIVPRLDWQRVT